MKKFILLLSVILLMTTQAWGFLYEVKILTKEEIKKLSNDNLVVAYRDVVIERKATEVFHGKAGFSPKEYENFKLLLGYIIDLRQEMATREMEVPGFEEWVK